MPVLLALFSSALWGTADFLGGNLTKRMSSYVVVGWSQAFGLASVVLICSTFHGWGNWASVLWVGVGTGVSAYFALVFFYSALSQGTMGVVAPITATGAVVPVLFGLLTGDKPSWLQGAGIAVAFVGVIAASGPEISGRNESGWRPLVLAGLSAIGFGVALSFLAVGSRTDVVATLGVERVVTVGLALGSLAVALIRQRSGHGGNGSALTRARDLVALSRPDVVATAAIGIFDIGANIAFGVSTTLGLLSIVAIGGSLYPVVTVILAGIVLKERLARIEKIGVSLALLGVLLISAG
ncbi:unannotated protein [freshwater metagenome]|uniref:Unannotated protein n=1 Tax=freshwater metagenome TaxID=449393 RepID=A0A6J7DLT2_9ZZZZ|nr:EamA family transporter [Actinomycetota bacterium]